MAIERVVRELRAKQQQEGLSLRGLASELGVSQPALTMLYQGKRRVTPRMAQRIALYMRPKPTQTLLEAVRAFIQRESHRSVRTREAARERLEPFYLFLARNGVASPLDITRTHIDKFLTEIAAGRRGKPLSASSVYSFGKDIKAFINHVADTIAPEEWRNPVRKFRLTQPPTNVRPLSQAQIKELFEVAESYGPYTPLESP